MNERWDFVCTILTYSFSSSSSPSCILYFYFFTPTAQQLSFFFNRRFNVDVVVERRTGIGIDFANKLKRDQTAVYSRIFR
jgi:hypothetical protein